VQCFWGSFICVFIYRIGQRHFDEKTARMAAIMTMLMPNLVMYCGLHLKEVVMTFLTIWFIERADELLINRNFSFKTVTTVALIGLTLFTFRTVLASTLFLAFTMTLIFSSSRMIKGARRLILIVLSLAFVGIAFSGRIKSEVMSFTNKDYTAHQKHSMEYRYGSGRGDGKGNSLAKYAGAAVFAPLIFTIPFPTMVETPDQEQKRMLHGGNYVKNVMSGFVILTMFMMLFGGDIRSLDAEWRKHVLPLAVLLGYLLILVMSEFAHSERFHQPVLPLLMLFAAYGVTHFPPKWRWMWTVWQFAIFAFCVGWAYFKLKGRGLD